MFEKTSRIAEKLATEVSRRGFLGSFGRWAGATALGLAGVLTTVGAARADSVTCCYYENSKFEFKIDCLKGSVTCPAKNGWTLFASASRGGCGQCSGTGHSA